MLDLSKKDFTQAAEAGYEFELVLPTGEQSGAFVTIRGDESKTVKAYARRKYTEYQQREQAMKRRGKTSELTLEEAEELAVEAAVVRLISWKGLGEAGKELPFTVENATRILKEHPWIRNQIVEESSQILNFRPV